MTGDFNSVSVFDFLRRRAHRRIIGGALILAVYFVAVIVAVAVQHGR